MGTEPFPIGHLLLLLVVVSSSLLADRRVNAQPQQTIFTGLLTQSYYPSIQFALDQILGSAQYKTDLRMNESESLILVGSTLTVGGAIEYAFTLSSAMSERVSRRCSI
jgi:hypothetical protein